MTTNQEGRQQAIRDVTSSAHNTSGDWHAYWDNQSVTAGNWTGRMLAWINSVLGTSYSNVSGAMHAYADNKGFDNWSSINEPAFFNPADLFASGEDGTFINANDLSTVFQERTGASATTPSTVGDPVGTILDQSGNGTHWTAPADNQRPTLETSGGLYYLDFSGTDYMECTVNGAVDFTGTDSVICTGFNPNSDASYVTHENGSGGFVLCGIDGSASAPSSTNFVTSYRKDGATWTPTTRNIVHDELTGASHVVTMEGVNWSGASRFGFSNYVGLELAGRLYVSVLIDRALTSTERADLESWIATRSGVTL